MSVAAAPAAARIWHADITVDQLAQHWTHAHAGNLLDIRFTEIGPDVLVATMPVDDRHRQPYGLLHGGMSCVLAETLGSVASQLVVPPGIACVGIELNASHLRAVREGHVVGTCRPVRLGKSLHVWDIRIADDAGRPVCISRLTVSVLGAVKPA